MSIVQLISLQRAIIPVTNQEQKLGRRKKIKYPKVLLEITIHKLQISNKLQNPKSQTIKILCIIVKLNIGAYLSFESLLFVIYYQYAPNFCS